MNIFAKVTKNPDFFPYLCLTYNSLTVDIMEQLLHYLWKYRLYRSSGLVTTRGDALEILDPGIENTDAGPDFFNAKIKLNGTVWAGSVEIHRKASDWWQHGHSADKAYDNVILHVVEQDDGTIFRRNREEIPQLVLPVPETVISNMEWLLTRDSPIACLERLPAIDPVFRVQWTDALLAARDPLGIRPLYYGTDRFGETVFASEPKDLVGLCQTIAPFPPGHYWEGGRFHRYIDLTTVTQFSPDDEETACRKIRDLLVRSVQARLDADAPLGFLLSGGLDSSLVCAISAKLLGKPIRTFAIGMDTDPIDLKYAQQAAEYLGADHTAFTMTRQEVLEALPEWTQDAIHDALIDLAARLEVKNATLMWPVRIAAAGKLVTPGGAVEICHILGREETLRRLRHGMELLDA